MLAQDFQDLTGQVIKKITDVVYLIEQQLLGVLLENIAPERREQFAASAAALRFGERQSGDAAERSADQSRRPHGCRAGSIASRRSAGEPRLLARQIQAEEFVRYIRRGAHDCAPRCYLRGYFFPMILFLREITVAARVLPNFRPAGSGWHTSLNRIESAACFAVVGSPWQYRFGRPTDDPRDRAAG